MQEFGQKHIYIYIYNISYRCSWRKCRNPSYSCFLFKNVDAVLVPQTATNLDVNLDFFCRIFQKHSYKAFLQEGGRLHDIPIIVSVYFLVVYELDVGYVLLAHG